MHIIQSNSRTSTHWKLNLEEGKVQSAVAAGAGMDDSHGSDDPASDPLLNILTNKISDSGEWKLSDQTSCGSQCKTATKKTSDRGCVTNI